MKDRDEGESNGVASLNDGKDESQKKWHKSNETLNYIRKAAVGKYKIRQDELEIKKMQ